MPWRTLPDGTVFHLRMARQRCYYCRRSSVALCDWPAGQGKTCDRPICPAHRHVAGRDVDHCTSHRKDRTMSTATQTLPRTHHEDGSRPGGPGDSFDDLASFDRDARPETLLTQKLETLSDGDYDFEITEAKITRVGKDADGDRVLRATLCVNGGRCIEHTWWLNRQESMNACLADLCTLGFDADKWGGSSGRSLAVELPRAVARMVGIKFRGTKRSRKGKEGTKYANETFHDLYINAVLAGRPMPGSAPAAPNGQGATPAAPPASRAELYWLVDPATNQTIGELVARDRVQAAVNQVKDAAKVYVMRQDKRDGWVSANKLGFAADPF